LAQLKDLPHRKRGAGRAESIVFLGLTTQRLFIVNRSLRRGDTRPLRSYRYGSELTRSRDLLLRPKVVLRGRSDRDGMRFVFPWRRPNDMKQIVGALSDRPLRMR
jgi:hypothetical protein